MRLEKEWNLVLGKYEHYQNKLYRDIVVVIYLALRCSIDICINHPVKRGKPKSLKTPKKNDLF